MFAELIQQLVRGATVVTPNRRLAAALRRAYDLSSRQQGRSAWAAADVLPWTAWLERTFREGLARGATRQLLMSDWQARALWHRVIADTPEAQGLLQVDTAAEAALEAWEIVHAWRLLPALQRLAGTEEARAFLRWAHAYDTACARGGFTDRARLPDLVSDLALAGSLSLPAYLIAFGFDALTPQQDALLNALRSRGVTAEVQTGSGEEAPAEVLRHAGPADEMRAAAAWARSRLSANPRARVGIVVPELTRLRPAITRIFDEVLLPDVLLHPGHTPVRPWNMSLGVPLSDWPLVHAALLILEIACGPLSIHRVGSLLRSPFLGGAESERAARAELDARLRRIGDPRVTLDTLITHAGVESQSGGCPVLSRRLSRLRDRVRELATSARPASAWGPALQSILSAAQWPGERELNSEEYQSMQKWRELIAGLAQLDAVLAPVTLAAALSALRRLAAEELFQPETPEVPIQVLGTLESAHLPFDHLMVLGLVEGAWPRSARPNPLLPIELQRSRGLPASSAQWELAFARRAQAGWRRSAAEVVFSFHDTDGEIALTASPLLAGFPETTLARLAVAAPRDWRAATHATADLERVADWQANALPEAVALRGGARVLQDQAACPFRAFAVHRLGAISLEHPHEGLDARDRGSLLHGAMAALWSELQGFATLHAMSSEEIVAVVGRSVDTALARVRPKRASALRTRFLELERERLVALLHEWLQLERQRDPFEVVATEQAVAVTIGGLVLQLRLDRVDRLARGGELLIDYKTGVTGVGAWMGDRPEEPQLPLYSLTRPEAPAAVAFAQVRRSHCALLGLAAHTPAPDGVKPLAQSVHAQRLPTWSALLAAWRITLERLAESFRSGAAVVDPKRRPLACRRCDLSALCRVSELVDRGSPSPIEDAR
jgi:probable DNA repair protein